MAVKEKQIDAEEFEWSVENEFQLFLVMQGHKPVGVNKYFHMVCIWEKFRAAIHKDISLKAIWDHLKTMYNLVLLDDDADLPFPSTETDFSLPDSEFAELIKSRQKDESESKSKEIIKDKVKEVKKEKDVKDVAKKEVQRDNKVVKELEKKKEDSKKTPKEPEVKKENKRDSLKEVKKDQKATKHRLKTKEESEEGPPIKKERKDSESSRESYKSRDNLRAPKRSTRQSLDSSSKTSSPRDTPPPKRRRN